ncbi:MAG TPA: 1-deoxy-D-xylulose-5-phosphate reductoisomerase [Peptococcaceae bacterium]|nr:1-deoxy-D-xylulose-5-phosphate reductoisomerase [Peptococcaceae bacterium]
MKVLAVLGSTGSIGRQTLEVVRASGQKFGIYALTANTNINLLEKQVREFRPEIAVVMAEEKAQLLRERLRDLPVKVLCGMEGLIQAASAEKVNMVVTAVSGSIGLQPTLAALKAGKNIALANKETLVAAGDLVLNTAQLNNCSLIPVDSEHSAIFQCLHGKKKTVNKLILTASGGPFCGWSKEKLREVTPAMALKHPNWNMGAKISIDSATLMNKALEIIEAKFLFGMEYRQIEVLVHPQSIVHSMVEYKDGSILAQLGMPDMHLPIQFALSYPERWADYSNPLSLKNIELTFHEPDHDTFPALKLAYWCGETGGTLPAVLNAANEICVQAFLDGRIKFLDIVQLVENTCRQHKVSEAKDLDTILAADNWAREHTEEIIKRNELKKN